MLRGRSPRFEAEARRWQPDLVYAHFAVDGVYAMQLAHALSVPLVVTLHAYDIVKLPRVPSRHLAWWRHAWDWRRLQQSAAAFVVISDAMREAALDRGYPRDRVCLIRLGVDTERFRPPDCEATSHQRTAPLRILHVGRLVRKKGLSTLLSALVSLQSSRVPFHLTVIGDGPLRETLEIQARPLGGAATFMGARSSEDVRRAMTESDVFCLPSQTDPEGDREGLPVVLMEAAAAGLPLVGTSHSGIVEIVRDGETGMLVPEGDVASLASALHTLFADPQLRTRLGSEARRTAEREFSLPRQTAELESLFDRVLQTAGTTGRLGGRATLRGPGR